jgi:hypothetical protein
MTSEPPRLVPLRIVKVGKEPRDGFLAVGGTGFVEVYRAGRTNRLLIARDPVRQAVTIDRTNSAVVVDGRRFEIAPDSVEEAEALVAYAVNLRGADASRSSSGTAVSSAKTLAVGSLASWANALIVFSYIIGILGVIGGLILALQTDQTGLSSQERPYLGLGIGVGINSAFFATIGIVLGKLADFYASNNPNSSL